MTDGWSIELCRPCAPPEFAAKYPEHSNWQWVAFSPAGIGIGGFKTREDVARYVSEQESM